jgi:hypothetical protein
MRGGSSPLRRVKMAPGALAHGNPDGQLQAPVESVLSQRMARVCLVLTATGAPLGIALIHELDGARARAKGSAGRTTGGSANNLQQLQKTE